MLHTELQRKIEEREEIITFEEKRIKEIKSNPNHPERQQLTAHERYLQFCRETLQKLKNGGM